jgi:hypothetical protein
MHRSGADQVRGGRESGKIDIGTRRQQPFASLLVALASCLALLVGGAANAKAAQPGGTPSVVYDPANGSQDIYYAAPDGSLRETYWTQAGGFQGPVTVTAAGTLAPTGATTTSGGGPTSVNPPPQPANPRHRGRLRRLRVKITLRWTWNEAHTRLSGASFAPAPRSATVSVSCHGRGCPRRGLRTRTRMLNRLLHTSRHAVYRAGDRLMITVSSPKYAAERVKVIIRDDRLPRVGLL